MTQENFAEPVVLETRGQLSNAEINQWRTNGFVLVDNLLPEEVLKVLVEDAGSFFPEAGSEEAKTFRDFGSGQRFVFPAESTPCNQITLSSELLGAVASLLGVSVMDIRLTQSDLWPKYGREQTENERDNNDQRIHVDYPNHTLVHPPPWHKPEAVEIIIFLNDIEASGGPTAVVPKQGDDDPLYPWPIVDTPGVAGMRYVNNRYMAEQYLSDEYPEVAEFRKQLYVREVKAKYRQGSVLFYRHDTWHRGTPVNAGARRMVQNLTFKLARSHWVNVLHPGWSWGMYRPSATIENLIAKSSVEQRTVLGFPPPGDEYWCAETIKAVGARYDAFGIDMTPYQQALC
jgi:ectoine hydroxylase-related dioxygenase (phytanoyl-CoA dioxygenase family)